jgi:hypothetical protein
MIWAVGCPLGAPCPTLKPIDQARKETMVKEQAYDEVTKYSASIDGAGDF